MEARDFTALRLGIEGPRVEPQVLSHLTGSQERRLARELATLPLSLSTHALHLRVLSSTPWRDDLRAAHEDSVGRHAKAHEPSHGIGNRFGAAVLPVPQKIVFAYLRKGAPTSALNPAIMRPSSPSAVKGREAHKPEKEGPWRTRRTPL
jgi:hypothetical protein